MATKAHVNSPFMDLPLEIRNQTYQDLLVTRGCCEEIQVNHDSDFHFNQHQLSGRILAVCRQMYHETAPILYGKNMFCIPSIPLTLWPDVLDWLSSYIPQHAVTPIKRLKVTPGVFQFLAIETRDPTTSARWTSIQQIVVGPYLVVPWPPGEAMFKSAALREATSIFTEHANLKQAIIVRNRPRGITIELVANQERGGNVGRPTRPVPCIMPS